MNCLRLSQLRSEHWFRLLVSLLVLGLLSGCKTASFSDPVVGAGYEPKNVYRWLNQLPVSVRRVAVLPTTCDTTQSDVQSGRDLLDSVIAEEFGKTRKFEIVTVSPEQLRVWTGRSNWRAEETLPPNLLKLLRQELDCDGVLFSRLTQYRAYPPLAVGLSLKLVEIEKAEFVWAVDEIFDASEPSVVNSARRYQLTREQLPAALADSRSILNSPSGFGRYAAQSVFQTLPAR
jgi:hypothetical protein